MKSFVKIVYIIYSVVFISYLILPNPGFPEPPADSVQSNEPADTETSLRRAYFTNFSREEVLQHYEDQSVKSSFLDLSLLTLRLNYPPEEARTVIRDQTRSTFLEEIVHPARDSLFINGFEPKEKKDVINIEGRPWRQKIIVRFVPSSQFVRLLVGILTLLLIVLVYKAWEEIFFGLKKVVYDLWIFR